MSDRKNEKCIVLLERLFFIDQYNIRRRIGQIINGLAKWYNKNWKIRRFKMWIQNLAKSKILYCNKMLNLIKHRVLLDGRI